MHTVDIFIVVVYMLMILAVGLWSGRRVKSAREFSVSTRTYGLFTMIATLSSSFIGGGFSSGNASETFAHGVGNILALFGFTLGQFCIGKYLLPRMKGFEDCASSGEIMERVYGAPARLITGLCAFLYSAGVLAVQIAAIGHIFRQLTGIRYDIGLVIGFSVVLLYSTTGGLASIIAIDRVQFVILAAGIPLLIVFGLREIGGLRNAIDALPPTHFDPIPNGLWPLLGMFVSLMVGEALIPSYVQRMSASRGRGALSKATIVTALLSIPFFIMTGAAGLLAYGLDPMLSASSAMPALILRVMPVALRGLVIASMLAIVLSAADTILATATVGLTYDALFPLLKKKPGDKTQLSIVRIANVLTGLVAMAVALYSPHVFSLLLFSYQFWAPVILAPLIGALWGLHPRPAVFYLSACAGALTTLYFHAHTLAVAAGFAASMLTLIIGCKTLRTE